MSKVWKTLWLAPIAPGHAPKVVAFPLAMAKANQILIEIFLARQLLCAISVSALTLVLSPAAAADAANSIMQRMQKSF